jgi:hypothetical protein
MPVILGGLLVQLKVDGSGQPLFAVKAKAALPPSPSTPGGPTLMVTIECQLQSLPATTTVEWQQWLQDQLSSRLP